MNRQIKFRVWNNKTKKWIHGPGYECNLFGEMILLGGFMPVKVEELNDCIPLQFTGLLDVNGKEIYEGDLMTGRNTPIVVEYEAPEFRFAYKNLDGGFCDRYIVGWADFSGEIIGNVYENPGLVGIKL